jgi:hypothetical protein
VIYGHSTCKTAQRRQLEWPCSFLRFNYIDSKNVRYNSLPNITHKSTCILYFHVNKNWMGKQCQNGKLSFHQTINRLTKLKAFEYQSITSSVIGVLMNQGATELTLILSLANSHARFLVSWWIPPAAFFFYHKQVTTFRTTFN